MALKAGSRLGAYVLRRRIGVGAMGEVWAASGADAAEVAIKALDRVLAADPMYRTMFLDEMAILGRLAHPNIARCFGGQASSQGTLFYASELIDGDDLRALLIAAKQARSAVPVRVALEVGLGVTAALTMAWEQQEVVHRDVKPANIMISTTGRVVLVDFGIALARERVTKTATGVRKGAPGYLSPEQMLGLDVGPRTDVFSLGIVLWELLSGRSMFARQSEVEILTTLRSGWVAPIEDIREDVPERLGALIDSMLEEEPEGRPSSADVMLELAVIVDELGDSEPAASVLSRFLASFRQGLSQTDSFESPDLRGSDDLETVADSASDVLARTASRTEDPTVPIVLKREE